LLRGRANAPSPWPQATDGVARIRSSVGGVLGPECDFEQVADVPIVVDAGGRDAELVAETLRDVAVARERAPRRRPRPGRAGGAPARVTGAASATRGTGGL